MRFNPTKDIFHLPLASHDSGGEEAKKSFKEKLALLVHCFAFTLEEGDKPTLTPSDSVGLWRTTGGSGSHRRLHHRPILPACPRPETREHTCPNKTYPNTNTNTNTLSPKSRSRDLKYRDWSPQTQNLRNLPPLAQKAFDGYQADLTPSSSRPQSLSKYKNAT